MKNQMTNEQKVIFNKMGLLKLANQLDSVSKAWKVIGSSRDSFYRFRQLYAQGGEAALQDNELRKQGVFVSGGSVHSKVLPS